MGAARFLALDLGAESGRGVVGSFDGERLALEEVRRFPNLPVRVLGRLHWDVLRQWEEVKATLAECRKSGALEGIGVDTWGVDFALLGRDGSLLGNPHHYRDPRTAGMFEQAFRRVPREEIFERTGIQFMEINTLYQLLSMSLARSPALAAAETLLMMPDLFHYWLTGEKAGEFTIATTSQCYDPRAGGWAAPMLEKLGIPTGIFPRIVPPGTEMGPLAAEVAEEVGSARTPVIAPASHDTGSAVAAVPATGEEWCYISSGTWSLMGVEVAAPVINETSRRYNFTNEGGVAGTFRLLKNIGGLWLVQECRRQWEREGETLSYEELTDMAAAAPPLLSLVDPDAPEFVTHGDMPARLRAFCERTGQKAPAAQGALVRGCLESLALTYRHVLERLEEMVGRRIAVIHIVGGGSRNALLSQFAADATRRRVVTGPVEATAIGNLLVQAVARGRIGSIAEGREVVRRSFETYTYEPGEPGAWEEAYRRFVTLKRSE